MKSSTLVTKLSLFLLTWLLPTVLCAEGKLRVADIFTDNAVLQQGVKLPIWGTTASGSIVTVRFLGQTETVRANKDGSWQLELAPLRSSNESATMSIACGDDQVEFRNLLVGEVWYASGQSNMQMTLDACAKKIPAIDEIAHEPSAGQIRWLRIDQPDSPEPIAFRKNATQWQLDTPTNRAKQSALAYCFARRIQAEVGVPVGIIEASWGGKPIEGFIPRSQFEQHVALQSILSLAEQNRLDELALLEGGVIVRNTAGMPGRIFNSRIAPIAPYAVRGCLWYQGESNAGQGEDPRNYRIKMQALVNGWREAWQQPDLPFYFVQLPAFTGAAKGWVRLREEQRRSLNIEHTGMAVTIDLHDSDIHPANKLDVANRLANWALAKEYRKDIPRSGPLFKSATAYGNSMRVEFDYADSGLIVAHKDGLAEPKPTPDQSLKHFELADASRIWHPAQAAIDGSCVIVSSSEVIAPKAVRYACTPSPSNPNLYNHALLPASPFCSDLQLLPWVSHQ